ncbi:MAG: cysteine--tRNA ligase, partial [Clostridia bacterium]|nr:cysteine--tRNA ligase [Clostridia bacterium]
LEEKGYNPLVYRLFCLQSHYRKSLVFSWEGMDGTKTAYNKLIAKIAGLNPDASDAVDEAVFASLKQKFTDAMDNDLNTALAVTALYDVLKAKTNDATKIALLKDFDIVLSLNLLEEAAKVREANRKAAEAAKNAPAAALVITCGTEGVADDMKAKVEELINARADAKKAKDFAKADAIRDELSAMGVAIVDVKGGVNWTLA